MKKTIMFIIVLAVCLLILPSVYADAEPEKYGTVSQADKGEVEIENNSTADVKVKYTAGKLVWSPADPAIHRDDAGWWIGFKFTAPTGPDAFKAEDAQIKRSSKLEELNDPSSHVYFKNVKDGENYFGSWKLVDEYVIEEIETKGEPYILAYYEFDWDGDDVYEQKVTIEIVPNKIEFEEPPEEYVTVDVKSEIGNRVFTVKKGESLNSSLTEQEKETLTELMTAPKGKKLVGLYNDKEEVSLDTKFETDVVLTVKFETITEKKPTEENPATGDNFLTYIFVGTIAIVSVFGTTICLKKVNE